MANRLPLVFDSINGKIKELPIGDNLSLTNSSLVDAVNISASGTITANTLIVQNLSAVGGTIAAVAISNNYNDLDNLPALFSGDYNDLINKPTTMASDWDSIVNKPLIPTKLSQLVNDTNFVINSQVAITASQVTNLSTVGRTNDYNDLSNKPDLSVYVKAADIVGGTLTVEVSNTGNLIGSVFAEDSTLLVDAINGIIPYSVLDGAPTALSEFSNDLDYAGIVGNTLQTNGLPVNTFLTGTLDAQTNDVVDANLVNATGNFIGDVAGSIFADDSSLIVDAINKNVDAININATTFSGDLKKQGSVLTVESNSGIQILPNGVLTIPNATNIDIDATGTIDITATDDLTLSSASGSVIVQGHINIADLQTLVAASTDFADFKSRIAALTP